MRTLAPSPLCGHASMKHWDNPKSVASLPSRFLSIVEHEHTGAKHCPRPPRKHTFDFLCLHTFVCLASRNTPDQPYVYTVGFASATTASFLASFVLRKALRGPMPLAKVPHYDSLFPLLSPMDFACNGHFAATPQFTPHCLERGPYRMVAGVRPLQTSVVGCHGNTFPPAADLSAI